MLRHRIQTTLRCSRSSQLFGSHPFKTPHRHAELRTERLTTVTHAKLNQNETLPAASNVRTWWQQQYHKTVQYLKEQQQQALYKYFRDWRKDAFSDLQAILLLALAVNVAVAAVKMLVLHESSTQAWQDFYEGAVVTFGEAWPEQTAPVLQQASSIGLYLTGLIAFAVLLALVEQSVLQVYETRVELGSPVLETGHILVLCWCRSQADVSKLEVILRQLCAAYKCSGGRTIVVLCQRKKTEMEDLFCSSLPQVQRGGSRFVFRQGNPLTAADLKLVAADDAAAVLVLADSAVTADASDSQVLRVLVLLDELEAAARQEGRCRPTPGHVVAEILTNDAMPLLKFVPSKAVLPLPSHRLNATRLAVLVTRPVVSHLTDTLWDFENSSAVYMHQFPQLAGKTVADVALMFEDGIVIGLLETSTGFVLINPPPAYKLNADERILLLRPTSMRESDVQPWPVPVPAPVGNYSAETAAAAWRQSQQSLNMPMVISCGCSDVEDGEASTQKPDIADQISCEDPVGAMQEQFLQRKQYQQQQQQPWNGQLSAVSKQQQEPYQQVLQEQQRVQAAVGRSVLHDASHAEAATIGSQVPLQADSKSTAATASNRHLSGSAAARGGADGSSTRSEPGPAAAVGAGLADGGCSVASWDLETGDPRPSYEVMDLIKGTRPGFTTCRMFSLAESSVQLSRFMPLNLVVLGWGEPEFMEQLLLALGTGSSALPAGSTVTFGNSHAAEATLLPAMAAVGGPEVLAGLTVQHVRLDPLARSQLHKLDLLTANAAIVLCDACWRHQLTSQLTAAAGGYTAASAAANNHAAVYSSVHSSSSRSMGSTLNSFDAAAVAHGSGGLYSLNDAGSGSSSGTGSSSGSIFANGGSSSFMEADVLQLDALLLRVQLNLRSMLQSIGREKEVNIITEKIGTEQDTRFEDKARLPLGVPVNLSSYTACMLSQLAFCPLMVLPGRGSARTLGAQIDPLIVDADLYTTVGDKVSFWQLMRRAQLLGHVLLGYYVLPVSASDPIEAVLCPPGPARYEKRIWNTGDNRLKFIVLQDAESANSQQQQQQQMRDEAVAASVASSAAARAAAAAKAAADASATYYPVDGGWQWWMR